MINISYDTEADAAYVRLTNKATAETREVSDVCILDLDSSGGLVAIELLSVFGFAGASLHELARSGRIDSTTAERILKELKSELVAV